MPSCSVSTCRNNNCRTKSEVKYYKFPKVEEYCIKWYLACGKPIINLKFATVCSQHFDASASHRTKQQEVLNYSPKCYRGLKPDAVPTKKIPWNGVSTDMVTPKVLKAIREWCLSKVKKTQENVEEVKGPRKKHLVVKEMLAWFPSESGTIPIQNNIDIGNSFGKNYFIIQPTGTQNLSDGTNLQQNILSEQIPLVTVPAVSQPETSINHQQIVLNSVCCINPIDSLKSSVSADLSNFATQQVVSNNTIKLNSKCTRPQLLLAQTSTEQTAVENKKLVANVQSPPLLLPDTLRHIPLNKPITTRNNVDGNCNEINGDSCETSGMALLRSEFKDMKRTISILRDEIRLWQKQYTEMKQSYEALVKDHKCSLVNRKKEVDLAVHAVLSGIFTPGQIKLLLGRGSESWSKKSSVHWTHRDMKTALALRNLSPRAYRYLRTEMNYPLPAPSSLRKFRTIATRKADKMNRPCPQHLEGKTETETLESQVITELTVVPNADQTITNKNSLAANDEQENSCLPLPVLDESTEIMSTV